MTGVLIDVYPLRPDEIRTMIMALQIVRELSLGKIDRLAHYLDRFLALELQGEENAREKINLLLKQINLILWKNREPWTLYDKNRASLQGLIAHGLECRLLRDADELEKVQDHLTNVLRYVN